MTHPCGGWRRGWRGGCNHSWHGRTTGCRRCANCHIHRRGRRYRHRRRQRACAGRHRRPGGTGWRSSGGEWGDRRWGRAGRALGLVEACDGCKTQAHCVSPGSAISPCFSFHLACARRRWHPVALGSISAVGDWRWGRAGRILGLIQASVGCMAETDCISTIMVWQRGIVLLVTCRIVPRLTAVFWQDTCQGLLQGTCRLQRFLRANANS